MFSILKGWTSQFLFKGMLAGGHIRLDDDPRLKWHIDTVGGVQKKKVLELGSLEAAHTKMLCEHGAFVTAIEGNPDCFLRCLIVKEAFDLKAKFIFGDFCEYVKDCGWFDIVSATGVLYHQTNPVELIFDISKITDTVFVWSQVASETIPPGEETKIDGYKGKINRYGIPTSSFCGGLHDEAFWMYPDDMRRCFEDAGFNITEKPVLSNINGDCLLFVASKDI